MLKFAKDYECTHKFKPKLFAIYFVKLSGTRLAGPCSHASDYAFFLDPTTNNPNDPNFNNFLVELNKHAKALGAIGSLNQTLCLEHDPLFERTALAIPPTPRFASPWLMQFVNDMENFGTSS